MYLVFSAEYLAKKSPGVGAPKNTLLGMGGVGVGCIKGHVKFLPLGPQNILPPLENAFWPEGGGVGWYIISPWTIEPWWPS